MYSTKISWTLPVFCLCFSLVVCNVISRDKRETFNVKSSQDEEELTFKNDIIGAPLTDEDFKAGEEIDDDEIDETRSQGDIDPILIAGMFEGDIRGINDTEGRNGILNRYQKWPEAVIPYTISNSYNSRERAVIARAMNFYHTRTCVKFQPRSTQKDYIHITRGSGCSSHVGRRGGVQYVSLGHGCVASGTVQHELMHAAGFWHEQSRYDRDQYVSIVWGNIASGMSFNFQKMTRSNTQTFGEPYDYKSVMHYGAYAFSKYRGRATIVPKQRGVTIGHRSQLSTIDLSKLNKLYQCSGTTGIVGTTKRPTPVVTVRPKPVTGPTILVDKSEHCVYWAKTGECKKNPGYMLKSCAKSCAKCKGQSANSNCKDMNKYCSSWATSDQCRINPAYMLKYCKLSCNVCTKQNC